MASSTGQIGSRIRKARMAAGIKQADLARQVEISASYLNLIEHDRRRIGGRLVNAIARELEMDPSLLMEGAEAALVRDLQTASNAVDVHTELDRIDEFANRFPGWAKLVTAQAARIDLLAERVETLADRMVHDPALAASLHETISAVTAIRSTSSILVNGENLDADWRRRFHANLYNDSLRLAEHSQALVDYLERDTVEGTSESPADEIGSVFQAHDWRIDALEAGGLDAVDKTLEELFSPQARRAARPVLNRYARDAQAVPEASLSKVRKSKDIDPAQLAAQLGVDLGTVLRRLAVGGDGLGGRPTGLVLSDAAGAILFRKPVPGFQMPSLGAACARWPVFTAMGRAGLPLRAELVMPAAPPARFTAFATAEIRGPARFDEPPVVEATMLLLADGPETTTALEVGSSCKVCPRTGCAARREASIL
ncbi:helix-turn-helix domain-containing protein [Aestuariibius insulae]|uniref:helix-turn-helix domain-containing protein n=1 Tax=Aestuariibius insulae TaxID=2058287 RepID=UPI00345E2CE0